MSPLIVHLVWSKIVGKKYRLPRSEKKYNKHRAPLRSPLGADGRRSRAAPRAQEPRRHPISLRRSLPIPLPPNNPRWPLTSPPEPMEASSERTSLICGKGAPSRRRLRSTMGWIPLGRREWRRSSWAGDRQRRAATLPGRWAHQGCSAGLGSNGGWCLISLATVP